MLSLKGRTIMDFNTAFCRRVPKIVLEALREKAYFPCFTSSLRIIIIKIIIKNGQLQQHFRKS